MLAAAGWPLARLLAARPFRAKLRSFPGTGLALAVLAGGAAAVAVAAAWSQPRALAATAALAGGAAAAVAWRARPGYGRTRGLPPGSLGALPVGPLLDDRFFLKQAARHGPVFKTSQFLRPMACVVGLERCTELLRRYDDVLEPPALPFDAFVPGGFVRSMPAARHEGMIAALRPLAAREAVRRHEDSMVAAARECLRALAAASARDGAVDPAPPLRAMVFAILLRVFFGIRSGEPAFARLRALYGVIDVRRPSGALRPLARPALDEIVALVGQGATADAHGDSLFARIVAAQPSAARDPGVLGNLVYMVQNARDDTAGLLVWALALLGAAPAWAQALDEAAARNATAADDLAARIALETVRLEQSEFLFRRVLTPISVEGFVIPSGWLLRLCIRESHRDPAIFVEPDRFDPDRFRKRHYTRLEYSPFGLGTSRHACLGELLAKTVARVFLVELARGFTWRLAAAGRREFDGWHWTPGRAFRIAVAERERAA